MNAHWKRLAVASVAIVSVLAGACAAPPPQIPATTQPALSTIAQPYAQGLRRAGVQSVQVFSNGARVRVATNFGELYLRYPAGLSPTAFAVYVDGTAVEVDSDTYNAGNGAQCRLVCGDRPVDRLTAGARGRDQAPRLRIEVRGAVTRGRLHSEDGGNEKYCAHVGLCTDPKEG